MSRSNFCLVLFLAAVLLPAAGYAQPYSEVYVFGESCADIGNAKAAWWSVTGTELAPSPPYDEGRFCNGPVYPEVIADNLGLGPLEASVFGGTNYAFGSARSLGDYYYMGIVPVPSIRSQVEEYLSDVGYSADPDALYLVHDGGSDTIYATGLFAATGDWNAAKAYMEQAALGIVGSVQMLADAGAVHFLVPDGPEFSHKPAMCGTPADSLVEHYNSVLASGLAALNSGLHVLHVDMHDFMAAVSDHFITECSHCVSMLDPSVPVCSDPDELMYWDEYHPNAIVQQLIGDAITLDILKDQVLSLVSDGALNAGQTSALLVKLDGAYRKLEDRKVGTAVNKVRAFRNQVGAFVRNGRLSPEQAEMLLVAAEGIMDQP